MNTSITKYNCICNIGRNINEVYENAIKGVCDKFSFRHDIIKGKTLCVGEVKDNGIKIENPDYDLKCNRILLECYLPLKEYINSLIKKYGKTRVGLVVATTNTGVDEYEITGNKTHSEIGNPAMFLKEYLGLKGYTAGVSTACTSGIKAFAIADNLIKSGFSDAVIVAGSDTLSKVPLFGFTSLEVLSDKKTNPFSKNRSGINIGEGAAIFTVEKDTKGINILGIGETTDTYHSTTPDPEGKEGIRAIEIALKNAGIKPENVDYINLHGTGTIANDLSEGNAVYHFFKNTYASSTKPLTGHCLGAAGSVETALCCALIEHGGYYPHIYDGEYDDKIPLLNLTNPPEKTNICMTNAFGFGGANAIMILGGENE